MDGAAPAAACIDAVTIQAVVTGSIIVVVHADTATITYVIGTQIAVIRASSTRRIKTAVA
jgi:hypothetical protein